MPIDKNFNPYENAWNLMKQMVSGYSREKKYLTLREIKYILRFCERGINAYAAFNLDIEGD